MLSGVREIFERFVFDPSLIDLVVWFPYLSWHDFTASALTVLAYKVVSDRMERFVSFYIRRACSNMLLRLALLVRPEGPYVPRRKPIRAAAHARRQAPRVAVQRGFTGAPAFSN